MPEEETLGKSISGAGYARLLNSDNSRTNNLLQPRLWDSGHPIAFNCWMISPAIGWASP